MELNNCHPAEECQLANLSSRPTLNSLPLPESLWARCAGSSSSPSPSPPRLSAGATPRLPPVCPQSNPASHCSRLGLEAQVREGPAACRPHGRASGARWPGTQTWRPGGGTAGPRGPRPALCSVSAPPRWDGAGCGRARGLHAFAKGLAAVFPPMAVAQGWLCRYFYQVPPAPTTVP